MQSIFVLITIMFQKGISKKITFNKHFARKYIRVYTISSNMLCMLLITSSRRSSIMAGKKFKMADLLSFLAFYVNNLTLWPQ